MQQPSVPEKMWTTTVQAEPVRLPTVQFPSTASTCGAGLSAGQLTTDYELFIFQVFRMWFQN